MGMLGINYNGRTEKITGIKIAFNVLILSFIAANLCYRFLSVFNHSYFIGALYIFLAVLSFFIILVPRLLTKYLFFFGFSLIFFGYRAYDIQSQVFETIVAFVCFTLFTINLRNSSTLKLNPPLTFMILCYTCLAMCSISLLPLGHILKDFSVLGFKSFALQFANTKPETFYYSLGGVNRLILYCILAFQLAKTDNTHSTFKLLYIGVFTGAVVSSLLGILECYKVISLSWYRWATPTPGVLHSLFLNRGWFAEFILITFPFVLIGVISRTNSFKWKTLCSGSLIICEVALLLAGARAGWLVYPVTLFICWFFVVSFKKGEFKTLLFKRSNLIKAAMLMPITIVISIVLVFLAFNSISDTSSTTTIEKGIKKNTKNPNTYLTDRASLLLKPSRGGRIYTWSEGFNVGREKPFFGMGYESFKWHARILAGIKESYFHRFRYYNKIIVKNIHDTPHNIYLQIFISNGIAGLFLWLLIIGYAMTILIVDLKKNRRLLNIPVFISIISFHLYGIFQSMQYVPMIWMLIFLNLGYALTLNNMLLSKKFQNLLSLAKKIIITLVLIGSITYFTGASSNDLAEKYGMQKSGHQASQQASWWPQKYTSGLYSVGSRRVKSGKLIFSKWCWTAKEAQVSLTAASDILRLRIKAGKLNSSLPEGLKLNLFLNDQLLDSVHFINGGSKTLSYYIPDIKNTDIILKLQVNRTFKPDWLSRSSDTRDLGVQIRQERNYETKPFLINGLPLIKKGNIIVNKTAYIPQQKFDRINFPFFLFLNRLPLKGTGLYQKEKWNVRALPVPFNDTPVEVRWTGMRASLNLPKRLKKEGGEIFLRVAHPDVQQNSVQMTVLADDRVIREETFSDHSWKKLFFSPEDLADAEILTFKLDRTWNPKLSGLSEDTRDLGVAIFMPK